MIIVVFLIWNNLLDNKFSWKSIRPWIFILITSIITLINYFNSNSLIKVLNTTILLIVVNKLMFKIEFKEAIIKPLVTEFLLIISESFFSLIMFIILNNNVEKYVNTYAGSIIANIIIPVIALLISKIKFVKKYTNKLEGLLSRIDEFSIIFFSCLIIFCYTLFAVNTYEWINSKTLMISSIFIIVITLIISLIFLKTKDDYYKINDKYNSSLLSLRELEKVLTNYRIDNHENRNHLMTIRNMTTSKKAIGFIDSILDNKLKDDKKIIKETSIIPAGGLRGLIYSKLLLMSNKNIEYELDVANSVRVVDILDYGDETMLDICKIVGIFLDNAIEEVDTIDDKFIVIEMFKDDESFNISITNTFDASKDKKDIYKAGVSTKGGNHGYGLSLVKKIVKRNSKLKTHHEVNEDEFTQVLNIYK